MRGIRKKKAKTLCFWDFWGKMGQKGGIFEFLVKKGKRHLSQFVLFFKTKKIENFNAQFRGKFSGQRETEIQRRVTIYRSKSGRIFRKIGTEVHTEVTPKVHRLRSETKNEPRYS